MDLDWRLADQIHSQGTSLGRGEGWLPPLSSGKCKICHNGYEPKALPKCTRHFCRLQIDINMEQKLRNTRHFHGNDFEDPSIRT